MTMNSEIREKYDAWVEKVCAWIDEVGPEINRPSSAMQSPPALDGNCEILFLGHDAHEPGNFNVNGANKRRFYEGNGTFASADKTWWPYWVKPCRSFKRIGEEDSLAPGKFMLMNLFYFGGENIVGSTKEVGIKAMLQCISFTDELVHEIVKPKVIVCFSKQNVYRWLCNSKLESYIADSKTVKLADKYSILQGTWGGIPVIGMNHPSARVSNDYFDTVFKYVVSLTK